MSSLVRVDREKRSTVIAVNETEFKLGDIARSIKETNPALAQMLDWANSIDTRHGSLVERDKYMTPHHLFKQFRLAEFAVENDNAVSGVADITEQLAFKHVGIECEDKQEQDIWNQILVDLDIETRMREMWRELFTYSNCYVGSYWGRKNYQVGAKTDTGRKARKQFPPLFVPQALSVMDVTKIVPVGTFMFNQEDLVYLASVGETGRFDALLTDITKNDPIFQQLISRKYELDLNEKSELQRETGAVFNPEAQYLLNPARVFRITSTKPAYKKFSPLRMKSIFELLDLKAQLREMDRAYLLGAQSFIVLVRVGSDSLPAKQGELASYAAGFSSGQRIPVVYGDHRLDITIVAPPMQHVLDPEKYRLLDSIISVRLYQIFHQAGDFREDDTKLIRVVTASMEARRKDIADMIFKKVIKPCYDANDSLKTIPKLVIHPRTIALSFDPNMATFMLDLRTMGDLSRYTVLSELLGLDEDSEYERRTQEKPQDPAFRPVPDPSFVLEGTGLPQPPEPNPGEPPVKEHPVAKPKTAPGAATPAGTKKSNGRTGGGNSNGGGANRQSARTGPARGPAKSELLRSEYHYDDDSVEPIVEEGEE